MRDIILRKIFILKPITEPYVDITFRNYFKQQEEQQKFQLFLFTLYRINKTVIIEFRIKSLANLFYRYVNKHELALRFIINSKSEFE